MAIESGASRGLRTMGIFVDLKKEVERPEKLTGKTLDEKVLQLRYIAVMREAGLCGAIRTCAARRSPGICSAGSSSLTT